MKTNQKETKGLRRPRTGGETASVPGAVPSRNDAPNDAPSPQGKQPKGLRRPQQPTHAANVARMTPLVKGGLRRNGKNQRAGAEAIPAQDIEEGKEEEDIMIPSQEENIDIAIPSAEDKERRENSEDHLPDAQVQEPENASTGTDDNRQDNGSPHLAVAYVVEESDHSGGDKGELGEIVVAAPIKKSYFWRGLAILGLLLVILAIVLGVVLGPRSQNPNPDGLGSAITITATPTVSANPSPIPSMVPFTTCRISMAVSDLNRDNRLSQTEYVIFLNRLSGNRLGFTTFAALPAALQTVYTRLTDGTTEIPIDGASPASFASATSVQKAHLETICQEVQVAMAGEEGETISPAETTAPGVTTPSLGPSVSPVPSSEPSFFPTNFPTAEICDLTFNLTCVEEASQRPCETIRASTQVTECLSDPLEIMLFYSKNRDCDFVFTNSSSQRVSCRDFNGGPPAGNGESQLLIVTSVSNSSVVYFEGEVVDFSTVVLRNRLEPIQDSMNISLYSIESDGNNITSNTLLQESIVEFSCPTTHLQDSFGVTIFVGMASIEQGDSRIFDSQNQIYSFVFSLQVTNVGVVPAVIDNVTQVAGTEYKSFDIQDGGVLNPQNSFTFPTNSVVDLSDEVEFGVLSSLTGVTQGGKNCSYNELVSLTFGRNLGPQAPTNATGLESTDSQPFDTTNLDPNATCEVLASIECVGRTVHGVEDCDRLLECPHPFPSAIDLTFTGESCNNENCTQNFGGIREGITEVFLLIRVQGTVLVEQNIVEGETVRLASDFGLGPVIDIVIRDTAQTILLQQQNLWTCPLNSAFSENSQFGAFDISAIGPPRSQRPLANIALQLTIETSNTTNANLAVGTTVALVGEDTEQKLLDPFSLRMEASDARVVELAVDRLDEWIEKHGRGVGSQWAAVLSGEAANGKPCEATAFYSM
ncbi:expressed unknown protein [Seminavis robusta]|uniref:EF-hand domain-containing protein n=1 Tax=Seminavis robusta TaxID=568900 RepID=A0A9N8HY58_9STRA|nr:expressed unknown protein [Seminavis robusta]|eukprot:Sro2712_g335310.1 n/a (929) ;mRNA; f:3528-6314